MSRINTNVSSLVAQKILARNNDQLQEALDRLSTGLRITSGKDDPAGLIASENLRRDILSTNKAISNSERANQLVATADSALGQISNLLNDIRGLVVEAANSGVLSDEQIAVNQLQVDSSLEAIDRIANVTTFQGRKLIDGSLDFTVSYTAGDSTVRDLTIEQANLGATGSLAVAVDITTAATQGQVNITNIPATTAAVNATAPITISSAERQAVFTLSFDTTPGTSVTVTAVNGGAAEDADGNGISVVLVQDATVAGGINGAASNYNDGTNTLTIAGDFASGTLTDTEVAAGIQAINGAGTTFTATASPGGTNLAAGDTGTYSSGSGLTYTTTGRDAGSLAFIVRADAAGSAANGVTVTIQESATIANNSAVASINGSGNIVVDVRGTVTKAAIVAAIDGLTGYTTQTTSATGDANYIDSADTPPGVATLAGGINASGGLAQDAVFSLSGKDGAEVLQFDAGSSITQLRDAINLVSDATGVSATVNGTTLELRSTAYGTDAFVDVELIEEAAGGTIRTAIGSGARDSGTDIVGTINGYQAIGKANTLSINSNMLDLTMTVIDGSSTDVSFTITGGGAVFQLGPNVVSTNQSRIGIAAVNTGQLGGTTGRLYTLRSGGANDLDTNPTNGARVVDEAITKVTTIRGRLGSFQRTTLESNIASLNDTVTNLVEAESQIRDADFAAETARLTRAQILVQSGTAVLTIANQNPQNVLSLLR